MTLHRDDTIAKYAGIIEALNPETNIFNLARSAFVKPGPKMEFLGALQEFKSNEGIRSAWRRASRIQGGEESIQVAEATKWKQQSLAVRPGLCGSIIFRED